MPLCIRRNSLLPAARLQSVLNKQFAPFLGRLLRLLTNSLETQVPSRVKRDGTCLFLSGIRYPGYRHQIADTYRATNNSSGVYGRSEERRVGKESRAACVR